MTELLMMLLDDALFAGIAAIGFALVFNVPKEALTACFLFAASAHAFRTLLLQLTIPIEWATFMAACLLGLGAAIWSRKVLIPRPVVTVAAVIPMVPGSYAYNTMLGLIEIHHQGYSDAVFKGVVENGLLTLFILVALSFGLAIAPVLVFRKKPIV